MKFVFTKEEVAQALSMTPHEFEEGRHQLEVNDFPKPIVGIQERWSIIDVINWVNRSAPQTTASADNGQFESRNRLN